MTETKTAPKAKAATKVAHKTLVEALAAFQADMPNVTLDGKNPHFGSKFATLANISTIITPKLLAQGIVHSNGSRVTDDGKMVVTVEIIHVGSGETKTAEYPVTATDPQKIGSAVTYFKRYGLSALTGVVADGDDDGNTASAPEPRNLSQARAQASAKKPTTDDSLKDKIRGWIGSDEARRKQAMEAQKAAELDGLKGAELQKKMIAELGIK